MSVFIYLLFLFTHLTVERCPLFSRDSREGRDSNDSEKPALGTRKARFTQKHKQTHNPGDPRRSTHKRQTVSFSLHSLTEAVGFYLLGIAHETWGYIQRYFLSPAPSEQCVVRERVLGKTLSSTAL